MAASVDAIISRLVIRCKPYDTRGRLIPHRTHSAAPCLCVPMWCGLFSTSTPTAARFGRACPRREEWDSLDSAGAERKQDARGGDGASLNL